MPYLLAISFLPFHIFSTLIASTCVYTLCVRAYIQCNHRQMADRQMFVYSAALYEQTTHVIPSCVMSKNQEIGFYRHYILFVFTHTQIGSFRSRIMNVCFVFIFKNFVYIVSGCGRNLITIMTMEFNVVSCFMLLLIF